MSDFERFTEAQPTTYRGMRINGQRVATPSMGGPGMAGLMRSGSSNQSPE